MKHFTVRTCTSYTTFNQFVVRADYVFTATVKWLAVAVGVAATGVAVVADVAVVAVVAVVGVAAVTVGAADAVKQLVVETVECYSN